MARNNYHSDKGEKLCHQEERNGDREIWSRLHISGHTSILLTIINATKRQAVTHHTYHEDKLFIIEIRL